MKISTLIVTLLFVSAATATLTMLIGAISLYERLQTEPYVWNRFLAASLLVILGVKAMTIVTPSWIRRSLSA